jgi:hypothetical protein
MLSTIDSDTQSHKVQIPPNHLDSLSQPSSIMKLNLSLDFSHNSRQPEFDDGSRRYFSYVYPEILSLLLLAIVWQKNTFSLDFPQIENVWLFLITVLLTRLIWNGAILIHGLGHSLSRTLIDQDSAAISIEDILEHRSIGELLQSFLPCHPTFIPAWKQQSALSIAAGNPTPWKIRVKAAGGLLLNLMTLLLGIVYLQQPSISWIGEYSAIAVITTNLLLCLSSRSDMVSMITGIADRFYCGNFGFIGWQQQIGKNELLPKNLLALSHTMGQETEIRGEQAGGGLTLARNKAGNVVFVGHKLVNPKRGNLTTTLEAAFAKTRQQAARSGIKPMESTIGAWHYRFGTSGPPAVIETHWHEWTPGKIETVWQIENGQWIARPQNINNRITHNGDFCSWTLFGETVENGSIGLWLERVLNTPNNTVGDSPKLAGMMDLLITKGMWPASVRLAYQLTVAAKLADAFGGQEPSKTAPNTAPTPADLNHMANMFEAVFAANVSNLSAPQDILAVDHLDKLQQDTIQRLKSDPQLAKLSPKHIQAFATETIQAFLANDLYYATKLFMANAQGSFGLATLSTLETNHLIVSALGQPITLGFDRQNQYAVYASEPTAVDVVLADQPGNYRLDLNQNTGEIAILSATKLVIYSMTEDRELDETEMLRRRVPFQGHPYVQTSTGQSTDPVERDLLDIPRIMTKIQTTWEDPESLNRQSAEYLLQLFVTKAKYLTEKQEKLKSLGLDPLLAESRHVDFLVTGVENSLWLGERFAEDLKTIYPSLSIKTMSSNELLHKVQYDFDSLNLAKQSIIFGISQSGQTFPTRQVLHACDLLVRQKVIQEFFILTGEPTSFIGSPLGQPIFLRDAFSRRIFTNESGRRTVEPATASVAAIHQTLTELLFYITRRMQKYFSEGQPLGMTLSREGLMLLEQENEFLQQNIAEMVGTSTTGQTQTNRLHQQLIQGGQNWAGHITEAPLAWAIHALYVLITVGWAIPFGYTIPVVHTLLRGVQLAFGLADTNMVVKILSPIVTVADIAIYIFGAWLWTMGLRLIQKRQLLARTGKRTLVIGDTHWIHQILKNYVSKLFSLSYGIASLEVHGDNPQDHLLHNFGHRVVRGTLLFLGVPDGRRNPKYHSQENSVLMTGKQSSGIHNMSTGPEIVAVGANPNIGKQGFAGSIVLPSTLSTITKHQPQTPDKVVETLRESRFDSFGRLVASYVFFWALAKQVASFPLLNYSFWKSQSRAKIMTTAAPVAAVDLDHPENEEVSILALAGMVNREQS